MFTGNFAEDHAFQHGGGTGVGAVVDADDLAGGIKARDWPTVAVENASPSVDLESTERENIGGDDWIGVERWLVERQRPIRFWRQESLRR